MGMMGYREANQVNWFGSRPGHNGTQVFAFLQDNLLADTPFYTVPAGETLFLTYAFIGARQAVVTILGVNIYTAVPGLWQWLCQYRNEVGSGNRCISQNFWPPIEVPAGYTIRKSSTAACDSAAIIHGWAE